MSFMAAARMSSKSSRTCFLVLSLVYEIACVVCVSLLKYRLYLRLSLTSRGHIDNPPGPPPPLPMPMLLDQWIIQHYLRTLIMKQYGMKFNSYI